MIRLSSQAFGSGGLAYSTGALTIITLFFGELLPKALGVSNPEMVSAVEIDPKNFVYDEVNSCSV